MDFSPLQVLSFVARGKIRLVSESFRPSQIWGNSLAICQDKRVQPHLVLLLPHQVKTWVWFLLFCFSVEMLFQYRNLDTRISIISRCLQWTFLKIKYITSAYCYFQFKTRTTLFVTWSLLYYKAISFFPPYLNPGS